LNYLVYINWVQYDDTVQTTGVQFSSTARL